MIACGKGGQLGDDLVSKKALLSEKKAALKALEDEIATLKDEIDVLDPPTEKPAALVAVKTIQPDTFTRYRVVQASITTDETAFASSETGGRLTSLRVEEGDYVKKGQLIATVDLQVVKDQITEIESGLGLAREVYDRQKRLWEQNIGSEVQYLQAKNSVERMEKSIQTLKTNLAKANIYAPISGIVDRKMMESGEMAGPGAPIVQIFDPNRLKIVADVPESYLPILKKGDMVDIHYPALQLDDKKRINSLGRTIDPNNRTFQIEIPTDSKGNKLKPNLLAEMKFVDFENNNAITVPLPVILQEVSGKRYVYTVKEANGKSLAQKTYVDIGESFEGEVIVTSGLKIGDKVITDGGRSITEGDPVQFAKATAQNQ